MATAGQARDILMLTPQLPFPPTGGGTIKSYRLCEHLAQRHRLSLACFLKQDDANNLRAFRQALPLCSFHHQPLEIPRSLGNLVRSYLHGVPLTIYRNRSPSFRDRVAAMARSAELLFCDHYLMFQYLPAWFSGRVILHTHNAEYLLWKRLAEVERSLPRRLALVLEAERIKRYELAVGRRADRVLAAPNDLEELARLGVPREKLRETLHLGDESLLGHPPVPFEQTELSLLYVGTLSWEPNVDGLLWFIEGAWPELRARHPGLRLHIIGRSPDSRLSAAAARAGGIILHGFVADLGDYYARSRVFVAPLRFGSGMKVKVVSAMGYGIPVVTTSIGVEGLDVANGEQVAWSDQLSAMAALIDRLLVDREAWLRMRDAARALVRSRYTWARVLQDLDAVLEELR